MSMVQSVIMGLIQGVTEFLPVSSSGHLALFKILFNVNTDTGLLFDIMLHVGTLLAVCIVYYKDIFYLVKEFIGIVIDCIYNDGPDREERRWCLPACGLQWISEICHACDRIDNSNGNPWVCCFRPCDSCLRDSVRSGYLPDHYSRIALYL